MRGISPDAPVNRPARCSRNSATPLAPFYRIPTDGDDDSGAGHDVYVECRVAACGRQRQTDRRRPHGAAWNGRRFYRPPSSPTSGCRSGDRGDDSDAVQPGQQGRTISSSRSPIEGETSVWDSKMERPVADSYSIGFRPELATAWPSA